MSRASAGPPASAPAATDAQRSGPRRADPTVVPQRLSIPSFQLSKRDGSKARVGKCVSSLCPPEKPSGMTEPKIDSRTQWKNTILAGLANYIDAGSIVAGAAGLALWAELFGLSSSFVGLIGAFSSNAISAGVGALIGGWLCDRYGRKRIYQWDLLVYAFGLLWIIFATEAVDARLRLRDRRPRGGRRRPGLLDADRRDRAEPQARAPQRRRPAALDARPGRRADDGPRALAARRARDRASSSPTCWSSR